MDPFLAAALTWMVAFPVGAVWGAFAYKRALLREIEKLQAQEREAQLREMYGA